MNIPLLNRRLSPSRIACTLVCLLAFGSDASALDPQKKIAQYAHEAWSTKNGLPEADVMAILQTRDGYLWVGTEEGLARFDGTKFFVFDRKTASLPNNRVQALAETEDGSLWIGTENGLSRLKNRQFTNYSIRDGLPSNTIRGLWAEPGGPLWITTTEGVRVWRDSKFEAVPGIEQISQGHPREVGRSPQGDLWVATDSGLRISGNGGIKMPSGPTPLDGKLVRTVMMEPPDVLWVGTNAGLYRLAAGSITPVPLESAVQHPEITTLLQDHNHNLWVGTQGNGLLRVNKDGVVRYSVPEGLSGVEVKSLYEDRSGNLWVGTFGGGLEVFRDTMFTPYGKPEGISQDVVWSVMEGRDASIWIGTQAGGLNRLRDGKVTVYSVRAGSADNTVGSLLEANDGTLWLGKDSGLSKFRQERVLDVSQGRSLLRDQVHAMYEDKNGVLWVGTRTGGLLLRDGKDEHRLTMQEGLAGNNVQTIIPSKHGGIWVGTLSGLSYYQNKRFINFTHHDGLSADQIISLYEDSEGTLWIGTDGLNRLKDGKVTAYGDREGLFDQNVLAILEDDSGYLWLSSNKGIFRVSKRQLNDLAEGKTNRVTPVVFGTADGMRSAECNGGSSPAAWKDRKGHLWFATVEGALKVDPRWVTANPQVLQVHIEKLVADGQQVDLNGELRLSAGVHELELLYAAPYFAGADRVRYRYKLEGFDKEWVEAGNRTIAYYTNLPPGNYKFQVAASAFDAAPLQAEAELGFYLKPYFYQTPIFRVLSAAAALALVFLVWAWTNRLMIARQEELRRLVDARTRELEAEKAELLSAKAALAQQVSHDPLTGLLNRRAILQILEKQLTQAQREKSNLAVLLLDLDHFKYINDTYGHLAGDDVLREFARSLESSLRSYDYAGRFGGEEFLIIMPGLGEEREDRIRELQQQLSHKHRVPGGELMVTSSIGVAWFHPDIQDTESLLKLADDALYSAKAKGRNRVEVANITHTQQ